MQPTPLGSRSYHVTPIRIQDPQPSRISSPWRRAREPFLRYGTHRHPISRIPALILSQVLYSLDSETCLVDPAFEVSHFTSPDGIDIFLSSSSSAAHLIQYQFGQLDSPRLLEYDSALLNSSFDDVTKSIQEGYPISAGYLLTTLEAWNATEDAFPDPGAQGGGGNSNSTDTGGNGNQGSGALSVRLDIMSHGLAL
jgi:hypothetical protein